MNNSFLYKMFFSVSFICILIFPGLANAAQHGAKTGNNETTSNHVQKPYKISKPYASTGSMSGTVTDSGGNPIQGVHIELWAPPGFSDDGTSTDGNGNFALTDLIPGDYKVLFDPYNDDVFYAGQWYDNSPLYNLATTVTVTAGQTAAGIDAQLQYGGKVSGRVTDGYGNGIAMINVVVNDLQEHWITDIPTDDNGYYTTAGVLPGTYKVNFDPTTYSSGYDDVLWYNNKISFSEADTVTVTEGRITTGINAVFTDSGTTGFISGRVTDTSGNPIAELHVEIWDTQMNSVGAAGTGIDGYYYAANLAPGDYKVLFDPFNENEYYAGQWYNNSPISANAAIVTVTAGQVAAGIDARLEKGGKVSGRVTGEAGNGIKDINVSIVDFNSNWITDIPTNADGYYTTAGVLPGSYKVSFDPATYSTGYYGELWYNDKWSFDKADTVAVTAGQTVTGINAVFKESSGTLALSETYLNFGALSGGQSAAPRQFTLSNIGTGTLSWSVQTDQNWLQCTPSSGVQSALITVSVNPSGLSAGTYTGTVTVSAPGASNSPQTVSVHLAVYAPGRSNVPFGSFDAPTGGSVITGSVAVTGWALDDIGVEHVKIYRNAVSGEGGGRMYIGDAVGVEGARPDVEGDYPTYPNNDRAGWGYMMLTNFLPNGGNGAFTLYAVAKDTEGNEVTLGEKSITCDNANAVNPFGAIDTPTQGGGASGTTFRNQGWALTPPPNQIPTDGSTITVYIDSLPVGNPVYNEYRPDIAGLFPGYANSGGAYAYLDIDTTALDDGMHIIYWIVEDDAGNIAGIGSRFFSIDNASGSRLGTSIRRQGLKNIQNIPRIPLSFAPVTVKKGYAKTVKSTLYYPGETGSIRIKLRQLERLVIELGDGSGSFTCGHRLPAGSTLDSEKGIFYWLPGPGFLGEYTLTFIEKCPSGQFKRKTVLVSITPGSTSRE